MQNSNENGFKYTYSAKEQAELRSIREKYAPTPADECEDKMARLRRLDAAVTQKAQVVALILGVIGALVLGLGMSLCMTDLGESLGLAASAAMAVGVTVGVLGAVLVSLAYPAYNLIVKRERARIAPEIIRLTDELLR